MRRTQIIIGILLTTALLIVGACAPTPAPEETTTPIPEATPSVTFYDGPIIDNHAHPIPPWVGDQNAYYDGLVTRMEKVGVIKTALHRNAERTRGYTSFSSDHDEWVLAAFERHPDKIIPYLGGFDPRDTSAVDYVREQLKSGKWKGIGELDLRNSNSKTKIPANSPIMMDIYELAAEFHVPVTIHYEIDYGIDPAQGAKELEDALRSNPDTIIIYAHTPVIPLMKKFQNLWAEISLFDPSQAKLLQRIYDSERSLLDRIILCGSDIQNPDFVLRFPFSTRAYSYEEVIDLARTNLGNLPRNEAEKIAYKNLARLLGVAVPPSTIAPTPTLTPTPAPREPIPRGFSPFAIAITQDGQTGYVSFALSELVFKVRLKDLKVEAAAELYDYFPIQSRSIALDASEEQLFVHTVNWRKLIVLDAQTLALLHIIDDIPAVDMIRSQHSPSLLTWDGGNTVRFINTETYEITEFKDDKMKFARIRESSTEQNIWYVVSGGPSEGYMVGTYDYKGRKWVSAIPLPLQEEGEAIFDLEVLPNEKKAYVATLGGWYPEYHAYGWLYSVDLIAGRIVNVLPIDGGALTLEADPDSQSIYVGTGWPVPNTKNILIIDTNSDSIAGEINLGQNKFGWPHTEMHDLVIDPANPRFLYSTCADGNAFSRIDLESQTLVQELVTTEQSYEPYFFVRRPGQPTGYVFISKSANAFELDTDRATIEGVVELPLTRTDVYSYSGAIDDDGRMLLALGEAVLEVDVEDMRLLGTHPLPEGLPSIWDVVLSRDQQRLYSIAFARGEEQNQPNTFVAINTVNFQVEAVVRLEGGAFKPRPFELPDGSKVYAVGGLHNGPIVIQVIDTDSFSIQKTLIFDEPGLLGIAQGNYYPFAYDPNSHTLFVGATHVVLAIDTVSDVIKKVIYLKDTAGIIGLKPSEFIYINALGLVYQPDENYLYIAHFDRSFLSIYDINNDQFLPKLVPLQGLGPNHAFANDDHSKIYTLNMLSDTISVIDVNSKAVEKVIDLHAYR